jgi:hypothetical protein
VTGAAPKTATWKQRDENTLSDINRNRMSKAEPFHLQQHPELVAVIGGSNATLDKVPLFDVRNPQDLSIGTFDVSPIVVVKMAHAFEAPHAAWHGSFGVLRAAATAAKSTIIYHTMDATYMVLEHVHVVDDKFAPPAKRMQNEVINSIKFVKGAVADNKTFKSSKPALSFTADSDATKKFGVIVVAQPASFGRVMKLTQGCATAMDEGTFTTEDGAPADAVTRSRMTTHTIAMTNEVYENLCKNSTTNFTAIRENDILGDKGLTHRRLTIKFERGTTLQQVLEVATQLRRDHGAGTLFENGVMRVVFNKAIDEALVKQLAAIKGVAPKGVITEVIPRSNNTKISWTQSMLHKSDKPVDADGAVDTPAAIATPPPPEIVDEDIRVVAPLGPKCSSSQLEFVAKQLRAELKSHDLVTGRAIFIFAKGEGKDMEGQEIVLHSSADAAIPARTLVVGPAATRAQAARV